MYYYKDSKSFYCFSCQWAGNIVSLVQKVKQCNFKSAVNFICALCHYTLTDKQIDNWYELKRFLPDYQEEIPLTIYDDTVLSLFDDYYYNGWINENISIDTMKKYNIKWYGRKNSIVIPCYDIDNNLVGIRQRYTLEQDCQHGKYQPLSLLSGQIYKFPTGNILYGLNYNQAAIKQYKQVILFESEKSVMQLDSMTKNNTSVAMFGSNFTKQQRQLLLDLGVKDVIIGLDFDYTDINDDKFIIYKNKVEKIVKLCKPYFNVYLLYSQSGHNYKDSPTDNGKEFFMQLYNNKIKL